MRPGIRSHSVGRGGAQPRGFVIAFAPALRPSRASLGSSEIPPRPTARQGATVSSGSRLSSFSSLRRRAWSVRTTRRRRATSRRASCRAPESRRTRSTRPTPTGGRSSRTRSWTRLVERAYRNNLTLQIAGARVLQARAQLNQSIGNLFPQQQGALGRHRRTTGRATPITVNRWDDNLLFSATWEIDVWGKIRRGIEADRAAYLEQRGDLRRRARHGHRGRGLELRQRAHGGGAAARRGAQRRRRRRRASASPRSSSSTARRASSTCARPRRCSPRRAPRSRTSRTPQRQAKNALAVSARHHAVRGRCRARRGEGDPRPRRATWRSAFRRICCAGVPTCARRVWPPRPSPR